MAILIGWLVFCVIVGIIASGKGRNGFGWFLLAFLISPLIAVVILIAVGEGRTGKIQCGECLGWVDREARRCRHCGVAFETARRDPAPSEPRLAAPNQSTDSGYIALTKDGRRIDL